MGVQHVHGIHHFVTEITQSSLVLYNMLSRNLYSGLLGVLDSCYKWIGGWAPCKFTQKIRVIDRWDQWEITFPS